MDATVFVEGADGVAQQYEVDAETGHVVLDRRLFTSMAYPADCGFIEGTLGEDGDPLDALVLLSEPTFPGCRIRGRVVGVFHATDEKGPDEKVILVPLRDPAWMRIHDVHDIPPGLGRDRAFFQVYKDLEGRDGGFGDRWAETGDRGGAPARRRRRSGVAPDGLARAAPSAFDRACPATLPI